MHREILARTCALFCVFAVASGATALASGDALPAALAAIAGSVGLVTGGLSALPAPQRRLAPARAPRRP